MQKKKTKEIFEFFSKEEISNELLDEIENNFKEYFITLVEWQEKERMEQKNV